MSDKKVFLLYLQEWVDVDWETPEYYVVHGSDGVVTQVYKDGYEQVMTDDQKEIAYVS